MEVLILHVDAFPGRSPLLLLVGSGGLRVGEDNDDAVAAIEANTQGFISALILCNQAVNNPALTDELTAQLCIRVDRVVDDAIANGGLPLKSPAFALCPGADVLAQEHVLVELPGWSWLVGNQFLVLNPCWLWRSRRGSCRLSNCDHRSWLDHRCLRLRALSRYARGCCGRRLCGGQDLDRSLGRGWGRGLGIRDNGGRCRRRGRRGGLLNNARSRLGGGLLNNNDHRRVRATLVCRCDNSTRRQRIVCSLGALVTLGSLGGQVSTRLGNRVLMNFCWRERSSRG